MPLFTRETARENALKGNLARKLLRTQRLEKREEAAAAKADNPILAELTRETNHQHRRLGRVRKQQDMVDSHVIKLLEAPTVDWQAVERAARSSGALADQARILAGVPLPGSKRPAIERVIKPSFGGPVES